MRGPVFFRHYGRAMRVQPHLGAKVRLFLDNSEACAVGSVLFRDHGATQWLRQAKAAGFRRWRGLEQ
jgi:hypothetical protein